MLHPSYTDLMKKVNSDVEAGDTPVVNSRYSIVMAAAKRARQIIAGDANVTEKERQKPLSTAVTELNNGQITILPDLPEDIEDDVLTAIMKEDDAIVAESMEHSEEEAEDAEIMEEEKEE